MRFMFSSLVFLALDSSLTSHSENGTRGSGAVVILYLKMASATGCINAFQSIGLGCTKLIAMEGSSFAKATSRIAFDTAWEGIHDRS